MADQGSEGIFSPFLRSQRINAVKPYLYGKILDYGCGSGKLASLISPENYSGYDCDENIIRVARNNYPDHRFQMDTHDLGKVFDTVVSLAVVEHVSDPKSFLNELLGFLKPGSEGRIILTTPYPSYEKIHTAGAKLGFFSRHASEEHQVLLNKKSIITLADTCHIKLIEYHRFLWGANQLAILGLAE